MKKLNLSLLAATALISTASFASHPQVINLCLDVHENTSNNAFTGRFVSTDVFDFGSKIKGVGNGRSCTAHRYKHGPKNHKVEIAVRGKSVEKDIKILPDHTCLFLHKKTDGRYESNYMRSNATNIAWNITLTQAAPMNGSKYAYYMHCELATQ
ncbi:MAG: hypothetical protein H0W64_06675 [Gammaproteobacteria bacterium]|nr:hypothetical protein [Gammaproteobacteria bacterium]